MVLLEQRKLTIAIYIKEDFYINNYLKCYRMSMRNAIYVTRINRQNRKALTCHTYIYSQTCLSDHLNIKTSLSILMSDFSRTVAMDRFVKWIDALGLGTEDLCE